MDTAHAGYHDRNHQTVVFSGVYSAARATCRPCTLRGVSRARKTLLVPINGPAEVGGDFVQGDSHLVGGVPIADGDRVILLDGVEVDRDAERGPDLVRAAVPPPDGASGVPLAVPPPAQRVEQVARHLDELRLVLDQRQHGRLDGSDAGVEAEQAPLLAAHFVFGVCRANESKDEAIHPQRRFYAVGHVPFLGLFVKVLEALGDGTMRDSKLRQKTTRKQLLGRE